MALDREILEESVMPEPSPEKSLVSRILPGFILMALLGTIAFVVNAKVSFDRQIEDEKRIERIERVIEELQKQTVGVSGVRDDVRNLDEKIQKMSESLNKRLDDLILSEFNRRRAQGRP